MVQPTSTCQHAGIWQQHGADMQRSPSPNLVVAGLVRARWVLDAPDEAACVERSWSLVLKGCVVSSLIS
eukprot:353000-Chlamydomonas_euryale.AAC.5